ncbi:hypothetical protein [Polycladidibacter stylochi]|uniref:hypothetical protein n=1 Tax=Polycladidibacter stylochi TaxID=1807766 RepID=UPI000837445F|nr:hypothetical protein [Pseudovibrio stylochi]
MQGANEAREKPLNKEQLQQCMQALSGLSLESLIGLLMLKLWLERKGVKGLDSQKLIGAMQTLSSITPHDLLALLILKRLGKWDKDEN